MSSEELVEIVDQDGNVVDIVPRSEMREQNLRHRSSYIAVLIRPRGSDRFDSHHFDADWRVVVHQRAKWKDVYPGSWDLAFGGVCEVGESWEESARRELFEEAGLSNLESLVDHGQVSYVDEFTDVVGRVFIADCDCEMIAEQLRSRDGEAVAFASVRLRDLAAWLTHTDSVCSDSVSAVEPILTQLMKIYLT